MEGPDRLAVTALGQSLGHGDWLFDFDHPQTTFCEEWFPSSNWHLGSAMRGKNAEFFSLGGSFGPKEKAQPACGWTFKGIVFSGMPRDRAGF